MYKPVYEIKLLRYYWMQQTKNQPKAHRIILSSFDSTWGLDEQLKRYSGRFAVREYVAQFYFDHGFKVAQIANKTGITRKTIYDWLEFTAGREYNLPVLPDTEELIDQWEKTRHIWLPIIYSKDIQIKI